MKGKQKVPTSIPQKNFYTYNTAPTDLRKKAVKKFEWWAACPDNFVGMKK